MRGARPTRTRLGRTHARTEGHAGAGSRGTWSLGFWRRRRDLEGAEGGPARAATHSSFSVLRQTGVPEVPPAKDSSTHKTRSNTVNPVQPPGPRETNPARQVPRPHRPGSGTAPGGGPRGAPPFLRETAAAELRRPRAGLPRARSEDPQAGPGRTRGARLPTAASPARPGALLRAQTPNLPGKHLLPREPQALGPSPPNTHWKRFRRSTSHRGRLQTRARRPGTIPAEHTVSESNYST